MNFIRLVGIFSCLCLCLLPFGNADPAISIKSSSRTESKKMVDGKMRTVYDISDKHQINDRTGQLVHTRELDFKSDFAAPVHLSS